MMVANIASRGIYKPCEHVNQDSSFSQVALVFATLEKPKFDCGCGHQVNRMQADNLDRG
jgi:hypothetical protein